MHLTSVNLGREGSLRGERTGIFKQPVDGPVAVGMLGLDGDVIASAKHHGGPDQAIYVYGGVDYAWWAGELGTAPAPGTFGENLTIDGLESARFAIGDRLRMGEVLLEVTAPRIPCGTLAARMDDKDFVRKFRQAGRPGLYCRVLGAGPVRAGERVVLEPVAGEKVLLIEIFRDHYEKTTDAAELRRYLRAPLAARARRSLEERLEKRSG